MLTRIDGIVLESAMKEVRNETADEGKPNEAREKKVNAGKGKRGADVADSD